MIHQFKQLILKRGIHRNLQNRLKLAVREIQQHKIYWEYNCKNQILEHKFKFKDIHSIKFIKMNLNFNDEY